MPAGLYDLFIEQGATFARTWTISDNFLLNGSSARMQIRAAVKNTEILASWTTGSGHLTIDAIANSITLLVTDEETALLKIHNGVYDLEIEQADGAVVRLLEGAVTVSPEVTR